MFIPKPNDGLSSGSGINQCYDKPTQAYVFQIIKIAQSKHHLTEIDSDSVYQITESLSI